MFERFTERARQVVVLAQEESRMFKHHYIGSEHILLGLLREQEGVAARVLESFDVTVERVREQVVRIVGPGEDVPTGQIPFTPRAKKILELSLREALSLGHNYIGTEHVLLGLLHQGEGVAVRILVLLGAEPDRIREEVMRMLSGPGYAAASAAGAASVSSGRRAMPPPRVAVDIHVTPDPELRRVLMAAASRALRDGREQFSLADLRAVIEPGGGTGVEPPE